MKHAHNFIDRSGQKFGKWLIVGLSEKKVHKDGKIKMRWLCRCDCGREKIKTVSDIVFGRSRSCGCVSGERISEYNRTFKARDYVSRMSSLWAGYLRGAKVRALAFDLTKVQFESLVISDCHYCGAKPVRRSVKHRYKTKSGLTVRQTESLEFTNGIDRKDPKLGYSLDNCVPCCTPCNRIKMAFGYADFLNQIKKIHKHIGMDSA